MPEIRGQQSTVGKRKLVLFYCLLPIACCLTQGCAHSGLNAARENFYNGRYHAASENLKDISNESTNKILLLMERGTAYQAAERYKDSTTDWVLAWELAEELDYYSLSRGASSLIVNERVKTFQGMPYERTLLHAFAAKSYMAMEMWDDAAVEARNIIYRAQNLDKFPDSAYTRYLAGFCMEMIFDSDAAARQYREADKLTSSLEISETGQISPATTNAAAVAKSKASNTELVAFILIGRSPTEYGDWSSNYRWGTDPYAEIYAGGKYLGRSYTVSSTQKLLAETQKHLATMTALKTVSRIALKETLAHSVSQNNELLGEILRVVLYSFETPDERRWETLPLYLQIARCPCPENLTEYTIKYKGAQNRVLLTKSVTSPIIKRGSTYVSFCRDIKETDSTAKAQKEQQQ